MIPTILVILDGWGLGKPSPYNAIHVARTPTWDHHWAHHPYSVLQCSGTCVGLPPGQMGNSEVGHMAIGAGRVVYQDLTRIDRAVDDGSFFTSPALQQLLTNPDTGRIHIMGLMSPGGVHSHENHVIALANYLMEQNREISVHCFLDGRDTPPRSAAKSLQKLESMLHERAHSGIASIAGRYYAMDRDQRWERTQRVFDLLTSESSTDVAPDALSALAQAYSVNESDEFVQPKQTKYFQPIRDLDAVIFMNFRADRARQLSAAFVIDDLQEFPRSTHPQLSAFLTLTPYSTAINNETHKIQVNTLFSNLEVKNSLGECLSQRGLKQLRISESEKYAHVTYFFSGGREEKFVGETRTIIPSPQVPTYDLQPEMSAIELTNAIKTAINTKQYDVIICNFANGDMVGHTGNMLAATAAVECLDGCLATIFETCRANNFQCFVTADHGNVENMYRDDTKQADTAHTTNDVPLLYVGPQSLSLKDHGSLADIAPTIMQTCELPIPTEMTGESLII